MSEHVIYIVILIAYLVIMLAMGFFFFGSNRCVSDYFLGGRRLNPWVAALSAQASDMSGWLLLGLPGTAYILYTGTTEAVWTAVGLFIGTYLNWLLVAKRLRHATGNWDCLTLPDFFALRFNDRSGILRVVSALFILIFFLFYTASMFAAGAKLFTAAFGISYVVALLLGATIIVSYTFLGGFLAVCWTDVIQGMLLFAAVVISPIVLLWRMRTYGECTVPNEIFSLFPRGGDGSINLLFIVSCLGWGLGYFGQPHILPRFMAIRSEQEIRPARITATIWVAIALTCAVACGVLGAMHYPGLADPEKVFIVMARDLFTPVVSGILLTAILAAIMSTADSQLLVSASAVSSDLYLKTLHPKASDHSTLWVSRFTVIVISLAAVAIVLVENPDPTSLLGKINASVFSLVAFAWAGFGAAFGPLVLFSLYWQRTTLGGAVAGVVTGGVTALLWRINSGGIFDLYELVPGFIASVIAIVLVSLITPAQNEVIKENEKTLLQD